MTRPVLLACGEAEARRLAPALETAGFPVARISPSEADPDRAEALAARVLILETGPSDTPDRILSFWDQREMDDHLPILILHAPGLAPLPEEGLDEPLERVVTPAEPREVVAHVQSLIREGLIRGYRRAFHDLSQPLTIARAYARKALEQAAPGEPLHASLVELDRQMGRIFQIAEDLQRKRPG